MRGTTHHAGKINWSAKAAGEPTIRQPWDMKPATVEQPPAETPSTFAPRIDTRQSGLASLPAVTPADQPEFLPPH